MGIERIGRDYIQFTVPGVNGGIRALARISAIQLVAETDCVGDCLVISVAGKNMNVDGSLENIREILTQSPSEALRSSRKTTAR